jgi:transcriptional regulator with XRE-family HTH domain
MPKGGNIIMRDDNAIMKDTLLHIRSEIDARGLHNKVLAGKAGVAVTTWLSWFPGGTREPQVPSLASLAGLARALPTDLLNLLVPDGYHIVKAPDDLDHDKIEDLCRDYVATKAQAHHKDSPAGREISDCERSLLDVKVIPLRGKVA